MFLAVNVLLFKRVNTLRTSWQMTYSALAGSDTLKDQGRLSSFKSVRSYHTVFKNLNILEMQQFFNKTLVAVISSF